MSDDARIIAGPDVELKDGATGWAGVFIGKKTEHGPAALQKGELWFALARFLNGELSPEAYDLIHLRDGQWSRCGDLGMAFISTGTGGKR